MAIVKNSFKVSKHDGDLSPVPASTDEDDGVVSSSSSEAVGFGASEVDSGMGSDEYELPELGEAGTQLCQVGNQSFGIPMELYDLPSLDGVLSLETWNERLSEEDRYALSAYLPDMDQETFVLTLFELFSGSNFHFGSPLTDLLNKLKGGLCDPRALLYRRGLSSLRRRKHYHVLRDYHNSMVRSLVTIKNVWQEYAGSGIEQRLRLLNVMKSNGSLGYNGDVVGSETNSKSEDSMERVHKTKRKMLKPPFEAVGLKPMEFGKQNQKGVLKVAARKSLTKQGYMGVEGQYPSVKHKVGKKLSLAATPQQEQVAGYGMEGVQESKDMMMEDGIGHDFDEQDYGHDSGGIWDLAKGRLLKPGKQQELLKKHNKRSPVQFCDEDEDEDEDEADDDDDNDDDDGNYIKMYKGRNVDEKVTIASYGPYSHDTRKKAKHCEKDWAYPAKSQIRRGAKVDLSDAARQFCQSKKVGVSMALDRQADLDEWSMRGKKLNARSHLKSVRSKAEGEWKKLSNRAPSGQRDGPSIPCHRKGKLSQENSKSKYARNVAVKHSRNSPMYPKSEETESDSDEGEEDEDANIQERRVAYPIARSMYDHKKPNKIKEKDEMHSPLADGVLSIYSPDTEPNSTKVKKKGKTSEAKYLQDINLQKKGHLLQAYEEKSPDQSPKPHFSERKRKGSFESQALLRSDYMENYNSQMVDGHNEDFDGNDKILNDLMRANVSGIRTQVTYNHSPEPDYRERTNMTLSACNSMPKKRKGKLDGSYPDKTNGASYLHTSPKKQTDDPSNVKRKGKKTADAGTQVTYNHSPEPDYRERTNMSLSSCNSMPKKRKGKLDGSYPDKTNDASYLHTSPKKQTDDPSNAKRKGKKTADAGTGTLIAVNADLGISEKEAPDRELETKLQKKSFTPITPTVHTGFSFSIVHLLSAVRKALITHQMEDMAGICNHLVQDEGRSKKNVEQRNEVVNVVSTNLPTFVENMDLNTLRPAGQESLPALTVQEIVGRVKLNPLDPCILETQEPLHDLVRGVLKIFSSKTAPLGAKGWKALISYEKSNKSWSWVGPVSSSPSEDDTVEEETSSEAWGIPHKMLLKLVDAFANWLKSGQETLQQIGSLPPPPVMPPCLEEKERFRDLRAQKSLMTISPSSDEVKAYFHREEFLRYSVPDRAFSYTAADGKKSIVAPLRRGGGKPTSKARDHFMLKPDRPPHVTILCLVRDAAARLPGSIGTRADVCTLIRDSQYIVESVTDSQVNQIVSGALDRLHYERDRCVQFDPDRKLWVYLHRDREEEDFEDDGTSSTKKWKRQKREPSEQSDAGAVNDVSCQAGSDPVIGVPTGDDDFNTDLNVGSSNIHMEEKAELVYDDLRPNMDNIQTVFDPTSGSRSQNNMLSWEVLGMTQLRENQILCQENSTNKDF